MKKYFVFLLFATLTGVVCASTQSAFRIIGNEKGTFVHYTGTEQVVNTALGLLAEDYKQVSSTSLVRAEKIQDNTIVVGIPGKDPAFDKLLSELGVSASGLTGKWEAYKIQWIREGNNSYLFVMGSDPRGAAYGVLELSRQMGVTPWVWWADVVPEKKAEVFVIADEKVHKPSVQYRGIFLNDEDWGLMPWSTRTFEPTVRKGAVGPETYSMIFELLLRLRANTIWPAMHECTVPFYLVEGNKEAAGKYGIIVSNSHAEPMMRTNTGEWDSKEYGPFNFLTNEKRVLDYWEERVKELAGGENIYTVGMRGIHDGRMQGVKTLDDETGVLRRVIKEQRELLKRNNPGKKIEDIPQQFVPYKEVLKAYDNGLELPDDVTLVWCDDNHGHIMRHSNPGEQLRSGGGGVYYHISYWGKPHDYLWLASTQPALIYAEMKRAWDNNARRLWILNVGDIKPGEYLTEFFLDMAWDIDAFAGDRIYAHQRQWIKKVFGDVATEDIDEIMRQYYRLAGQRKPEHLAWNRVEDWELRKRDPSNRRGLQPVKDSEFSPVEFGDEMERRIGRYNKIAALSKQVYENLPERLRPAYFQLVHYPVAASAAMNRKMLYAQKSRLHAEENIDLSAYYARLSLNAYNEIAALGYTYNKETSGGKWELMMDMNPRNLPVFAKPVLPEMPVEKLYETHVPPLPQVRPLVPAAGTSVESDRMIALNACDFVNDIQAEVIEGLGHGGKSVRLPAAQKITAKQPHLQYDVTTASKGEVKIKIGTIPMHPVHGNTEMRYAIVIDKQKPVVIPTAAAFLSDTWAANVLRNQSLTTFVAHIAEAGEHTIRVYALDEELIIDQLMLDFDLDREHYLIPVE